MQYFIPRVVHQDSAVPSEPTYDPLVGICNPYATAQDILLHFYTMDGKEHPKSPLRYTLKPGRSVATTLITNNVFPDPPQNFEGFGIIELPDMPGPLGFGSSPGLPLRAYACQLELFVAIRAVAGHSAEVERHRFAVGGSVHDPLRRSAATRWSSRLSDGDCNHESGHGRRAGHNRPNGWRLLSERGPAVDGNAHGPRRPEHRTTGTRGIPRSAHDESATRWLLRRLRGMAGLQDCLASQSRNLDRCRERNL